MPFWNAVIKYFWGGELPAVLTMALVLAVLLFHFRRDVRRSLFNTLGFFFACLLGLFGSGLLHALEFARAAAILHEVFVIGGGIALIRLWGLAIFRIVLPLVKLAPPSITEDIVVIIAYIAWGMVRLRYAGVDLGSIVATSAMITAVVAFAMQDTLGNILGGLALQLDNSIGIGDWIKVDDVAGKVVDIRWRSTLVETRNWETVVFPNSQLMKNKFLVLGRRTGQPVQLRRWIWFDVGLDTPMPKVIGIVEETVRQCEIANVAREPAPNCVMMEIGDTGYARYALRYWLTDLAPDDPTDAAVRWHVMTALQRAGVKLAMEERGVLITKENEKYEEMLHRREILLRVKTLKKVELFSQMTEEELTTLAERLRFSPFAKGEVISREGATAHWLYIVISGEAEVYLETPDGGRRVLRDLGKGSFFGEMGMMTGAPRSASVLAKTDVECYRLDKEMFEEILHKRPGIAEEISQVLAVRKAEQDNLRQGISADASRNAAQHSGEILATIKRFFGLSG
jgi:CRP-like cAMP-binding protein/small-conductance mechanosensitive channel